MTPSANQPTHLFVQNLLDIPTDADFGEMTKEQKRDVALWRIASDLAAIREHGCDKRGADLARIIKLEGFRKALRGAFYGIGIVGAVVGFIFMVIEFVGRHGER